MTGMFIGDQERMRRNSCLACGKLLDAASPLGVKKARPRMGDATVCIRCGHLMMFGKRGRLIEPTKDERAELSKDPKIKAVLMAIGRMGTRQ